MSTPLIPFKFSEVSPDQGLVPLLNEDPSETRPFHRMSRDYDSKLMQSTEGSTSGNYWSWLKESEAYLSSMQPLTLGIYDVIVNALSAHGIWVSVVQATPSVN